MSRSQTDPLAGTRAEIRRVVLYEWDPIGLDNRAEAEGEYDPYVPTISRLVTSGRSADEVFRYLWSIETESMGLKGDFEATRRIAGRLCALMTTKR